MDDGNQPIAVSHLSQHLCNPENDDASIAVLIDPAGFIHEPLRAEVAQALGKLRDNAIDTLE